MTLMLSVLGPVQLVVDPDGSTGQPVPQIPPKQQAMLAMLAFARGREVSVDELIAGVWGLESPRSALGAVRNYVWSSRKLLGAGPVTLSSEPGGYRLDGALELDIDRVQRLRATVAAARREGRLAAAEDTVRQTFGYWRGDPLAGVPGPWAAGQRARLRRLLLSLHETGVEIAIDRGDYGNAIADLEALIAAEPLSEQLRALLMTALYRSGRRAAALEVYQQIRRLLVRQQGIEPGPALAELHRQILADEPARSLPPPAGPAVPPDSPAPQDLVHGLWAALPPDDPALVAVIVCDNQRAEQVGLELIRRGLLESTGPGGYGPDSRTRVFVRDAAPDGSIPERKILSDACGRLPETVNRFATPPVQSGS
ncbi:hypothetical protein KO481_27275 [Nocardia sp. NEAU-G5]|uniref:OmpR/PhoB-type domain-containing protein n=1 Tax=Nocardia albiluteola TaxID=2842303 RepID=A0ABS6B737_9NOCA|nr:BTAD domain-containing putative transcriptional regulator [Nocardia albiluteola]MBU3065216.1 hypothetical protein [Nocardia albiluteola]